VKAETPAESMKARSKEQVSDRDESATWKAVEILFLQRQRVSLELGV
jgi:hypothetical protein